MSRALSATVYGKYYMPSTGFKKLRKTQTATLTTPDMIRSGRVLRASVKSLGVNSNALIKPFMLTETTIARFQR